MKLVVLVFLLFVLGMSQGAFVRKPYKGNGCAEANSTNVLDTKQIKDGSYNGTLHLNVEGKITCSLKKFCVFQYLTLRQKDGDPICPQLSINEFVCSDDNREIIFRNSVDMELSGTYEIGVEIYHGCDYHGGVLKIFASLGYVEGDMTRPDTSSHCNFIQYAVNATNDGHFYFDESQANRYQYTESAHDHHLRNFLNNDELTEEDMDELAARRNQTEPETFSDCVSGNNTREDYGVATFTYQ